MATKSTENTEAENKEAWVAGKEEHYPVTLDEFVGAYRPVTVVSK